MDHQCALRSGIRCQKVAESVYFDTSRKTDNHPSVLQKRRAGRNLVPFHLFFFPDWSCYRCNITEKKKIKNKKYRLHSNCVAGSSLRAFDRSLVITTVLLCKEADTWIISYSFASSGQLAREHDCNWSQAESIQPLTANSLVSGKLWSIERDRFFRKRAVISDLRPKGSIARLRYNPATEVIQWQMRLANCYDYLHVED